MMENDKYLNRSSSKKFQEFSKFSSFQVPRVFKKFSQSFIGVATRQQYNQKWNQKWNGFLKEKSSEVRTAPPRLPVDRPLPCKSLVSADIQDLTSTREVKAMAISKNSIKLGKPHRKAARAQNRSIGVTTRPQSQTSLLRRACEHKGDPK